MPNRYEKLLIGTLIVTPVLIVASLISTLGINVAFLDEWDASAPLAIQAADGKLSLPFLFTQHNDHRIVPTKLTVVLSTWLTDWDSRFEMWVSVVLAALTFLLLLDILRSQENPKWLWLGVPLAWLVFSVRQAYNWLIGVQTAFLWFSSFSVLSVWLLMRLKVDWKALFGMALAAFAASWSLGGGLPLWIAMLPGLWLRGYRKWQYYATWLLVAGLCAWLYFNDFTLFGRELGREQTSLLNYFVYVLMFLGSPFVSERLESTSLAIFIGASGIGLFAWNVLRLWRSAPRQLMAAAFVLFLLSLTNAAMAAQGRAGYLAYSMTTQPLLSRYVTAANFLWIGLLLLVALNFLQSRQDSMGLVNALGFIVATLLYAVANFQTVLISSPASPLPSHENRACVLNVLFMRDRSCFEELYPPRPEIHITTAQRLAERRLNAFANWQADFPAAPQPAFAHVQPVLGVVGEESYRPRWISDAEGVALFQHPPSTAEQHLQLPDAPQVFFEAEIYVDLRNVREHPDVPQTGADFRLGIREGRQVRTLYEGSFEVNSETAPIPIRVDLSAWRGRAVVLVYETVARQEHSSYTQALWRSPCLTVEY